MSNVSKVTINIARPQPVQAFGLSAGSQRAFQEDWPWESWGRSVLRKNAKKKK